jgi:hypothetical protein
MVAPCWIAIRGTFEALMFPLDADTDASRDLDDDYDNAFDFLDDGTAGPISDDGILCGSGVPGDPLQDPLQVELDARERARLAAALAGGLPPRSPAFCRTTNALLGFSGESDPARRDFLWHGATPPLSVDGDGDGIVELLDSCLTVANSDQLDADADGAGDACDNCVATPNPRIARLAAALTYTGGQRDDDADGYGNACDADFAEDGPIVTGADFNEMKASVGRLVPTQTCGTSGTDACARYDLDGIGRVITASDFNGARAMVGREVGPRCAVCGDFDVLPCNGPACPP